MGKISSHFRISFVKWHHNSEVTTILHVSTIFQPYSVTTKLGLTTTSACLYETYDTIKNEKGKQYVQGESLHHWWLCSENMPRRLRLLDSFLDTCAKKNSCGPACLVLGGKVYYEGDVILNKWCCHCICKDERQIYYVSITA